MPWEAVISTGNQLQPLPTLIDWLVGHVRTHQGGNSTRERKEERDALEEEEDDDKRQHSHLHFVAEEPVMMRDGSKTTPNLPTYLEDF